MQTASSLTWLLCLLLYMLPSLAAQTLPYSHLGGREGSGVMAYLILFRAEVIQMQSFTPCHVHIGMT